MICHDSQFMLYAITIGRLNNAASSVAVPLAIKVASQAASASCERPSSTVTPCSPLARTSSSMRGRSAGRAGTTKRSPGRWRCMSTAASKKRRAMYCTSDCRLPGRIATTVSSSPRPRLWRAARRSG
ncbi:hypothetical protein D9M69_597780 [compost metagenome]